MKTSARSLMASIRPAWPGSWSRPGLQAFAHCALILCIAATGCGRAGPRPCRGRGQSRLSGSISAASPPVNDKATGKGRQKSVLAGGPKIHLNRSKVPAVEVVNLKQEDLQKQPRQAGTRSMDRLVRRLC